MQRPFRIGTRGSPLALVQANMVADQIRAAHGLKEQDVELVPLSTKGDRIQNRNLSEIGGKGIFTEEIEDGLLDGSLDLAVHSMKDMPTVLPDGLIIDCVLEREDPRDCFVSLAYDSFDALPDGARVGTSSLRRGAQVKARYPHVEIVPFRGNVQTRMKKLGDQVADATLLAMAGLKRLGMEQTATRPLAADEMLPAVAQGIIGIERAVENETVAALLSPLNHEKTALVMAAERSFLAELDGSCRTPLAAYAELLGDELLLRGMILKPDGSAYLEGSRRGAYCEAAKVGAELGRELKERAGPDYMTS